MATVWIILHNAISCQPMTTIVEMILRARFNPKFSTRMTAIFCAIASEGRRKITPDHPALKTRGSPAGEVAVDNLRFNLVSDRADELGVFVVLVAFTALFLALKRLLSFLDSRTRPIPSLPSTPENRRLVKIKLAIPLTTISCAILLNQSDSAVQTRFRETH